MKVLLLNGSPNEKGSTHTALSIIAEELHACGIESEFFWIEKAPIGSCYACRACKKTGKCAQKDAVNDFVEKAKDFDGFVFGSPVHYAGASGAITAFLDRVFYSGGKTFYLKPGSAIVCCRRGGATAALDQLNKYFSCANMLLVGSQYWNMIHGHNPVEVVQDVEGVQTMRTVARNLAWVLSCIEKGPSKPILPPINQTNFIR